MLAMFFKLANTHTGTQSRFSVWGAPFLFLATGENCSSKQTIVNRKYNLHKSPRGTVAGLRVHFQNTLRQLTAGSGAQKSTEKEIL